jgi:hypothetical protein
MWEYKVVSGTYSVDGANVFVKNPAGEGTLQQVLDHYGTERWELVSSHLDGVQREAVFVFKRPKGGAAAPISTAGAAPGAMAAAPAAASAPAARATGTFVDPDGEVVRRRAAGSPPAGGGRAAPIAPSPAPTAAPQPGGRRNRRDLDKLMRDD